MVIKKDADFDADFESIGKMEFLSLNNVFVKVFDLQFLFGDILAFLKTDSKSASHCAFLYPFCMANKIF